MTCEDIVDAVIEAMFKNLGLKRFGNLSELPKLDVNLTAMEHNFIVMLFPFDGNSLQILNSFPINEISKPQKALLQ